MSDDVFAFVMLFAFPWTVAILFFLGMMKGARASRAPGHVVDRRPRDR